ncbi:ATP-dependent RNA helicase RhlE [Catalinimonas alkaloidigena]|uniref:DEAD/DEAH box helicase n=1 Tax=Catalinimonas alkaloidigena TaxID=1075417 RepID=UPI00240689EF|nr:DEAD/DEAH box helicase [Catalinimonas alkaloidigena]MDF9795859.1 ATP-dependent RNA helicase RhlE [Catalinimonas alkaloidigena]
MSFKNFKFQAELQEGISAMGFEEPTPVQQQAIPPILSGKDVIACAQTGTGKTAAYLLPILNDLVMQPTEYISSLIIVPTRELAVQIDQQLEGFSYFTSVSSITIYGGSDGATFDRQKSALKKGTGIIVATPGKLMSHLNLGYVDLKHLRHFILDEADRMLDMGFYEDIMRIASYLPEKKQTLMFSATMPPKIRQLAKNVQVDPEEINIAISKTASGILQAAFILYDNQKLPLLEHLLKAKKIGSLIVFCARKVTVKEISKALDKLDYQISAIHSDLEQSEREEIMRKFRNKQIQVLVATDILSRGIDVEGIELVINYDVPNDAEDYVHRVGRTARADKKGAAFTFVGPKEQRSFSQIESLIEKEITKAKLPDYIGDGPAYNPGSFGKGKGKSFKKGRKKNK